jgi:GAF domain-containing protein
VGGRKAKRGTPWGRVVLERGDVFVARNPDEVRDAFSDHALIFSLGIGSIMNIPLAYRGRRLGTMNISHDAGWFSEQDAAAGRLIAPCVVMSLLAE